MSRNLQKKITKFVPIYQYATDKDIPKQTIYRWIRERKVADEFIRIEERMVKRIMIDSEFIKRS